MIAHLEGQYDRDEAVEQVKIRTRRFARGQETWFRNMDESRVIERSGEWDIDVAADEILQAGQDLQPLE